MSDGGLAPDPGAAPRPPAAPPPMTALLWIAGLVAVAALAYLFRSLLVPLLVAALIAYLLNPLVSWAEGFAIRRSVAVAGLFVGIGLLAVSAAVVVGPRLRAEAVSFMTGLPTLSASLEKAIGAAMHELGEGYPQARRFLPPPEQPEGWLERFLEARAGNVADVLGQARAIALVVVLVPIFAFFLLRDGGRIVAGLIDRLHPAHIETSVAVWYEIDRIIGRYLRGLALDGIVIGLLATGGLWLLGVPFPLLLGAFTALVNPLPYLGTLLAVTAAGVVALANAQGLGTVGWILVLYGVIRILDDLVVSVLTIGGSVRLHPMLVLASIIAGEQALGLLGMVLAVPLVTVLKETVRLLLEHRRALTRGPLPHPRGPVAVPHYVC